MTISPPFGADTATLADRLVAEGLAGVVATAAAETVRNCGRLVAGDPDYTFGLSDWRSTTLLQAVEAVEALCGGDPAGDAAGDPTAAGWIDPARAVRAIELHRDRIAAVAAAGGARVLLLTGHPTGLLPHWQAVARALQATGSALLAPRDDDRWLPDDLPDGELPAALGSRGRRVGLRYLDGVGCAFDGGTLLHTHRSVLAEAALDALGPGGVDLVLADHGMAGAAIERGIPTLSIADVNDPALALAQARGRTDGVLPVDDNLAPRRFLPVTRAVLAW